MIAFLFLLLPPGPILFPLNTHTHSEGYISGAPFSYSLSSSLQLLLYLIIFQTLKALI